jgi:hypothetical protein
VTSPDSPSAAEVERVPLKVVPIYVQPIDDEPEPVEEVVVEEPAPPRRPPVWIAAVVLALGTIGVHIAAIVVASAGDFPTGTLLGYVAIGLSLLSVIAGVVAAILGRGRTWGIVAAVIAVLANPFVLLTLLTWLSGLQS